MTINIAALSDIIQTRAPQLFIDNVTRLFPFLAYLRQSGLVVGPTDAKGPRWRVKTTGSSSAQTFAEGAPQPAGTDFAQTEASLSWGAYTDTVSLTSQAQAQLNAAGATYINQYLVEQFSDHTKQLASLVETHLLSGINANGITGITEAIDDTNTYANINRAVVTNFASYINDNAGVNRALTLALMDTVHNMMTATIGGNYTEIWSGPAQFDAATALAAGNGLLTQQQTYASGESPVRSHGYTGMTYRGRPFRVFAGYPAHRIDFVDPMAFSLEVLPSSGNPAPTFVDDPLAGAIKVQQLANVNGDVNYRMELFAQLKLTAPRFAAAGLVDLT